MTSDALQGGSFAIAEGRDGWLFLESAENVDVIRLYVDESYMTQDIIDRWTSSLKQRREYFAGLGITYASVVLPEACIVYTEGLPVGLAIDAPAPALRVIDALDADSSDQFLYVHDALVAGKADGLTYRKTDSHWTDWGAWLAYQATMQHLATKRPDIVALDPSRVKWNVTPVFGALGVAMHHDTPEMLPVAEVVGSACELTTYVANEVREAYMVVEQDRPELPTAVVFRDSSMTNAHKFFSESFRRTAYCSQPNAVLRDLIEREMPDVVLFVTGERRLYRGPNDSSFQDFRHMFGDLLMADPDAVAAQVDSRSLFANGDFVGALAANAVALESGASARLLFHRARCFAELGDTDAALTCFRDALQLDPEDGPVWHAYGHLLYATGDLPGALLAFERSTQISPEMEAFGLSETKTLLAMREHSKALERARILVGQHPQSARVQFVLGCALADVGALAEAEVALRRALELDPGTGAGVMKKLASVMIRMRRWTDVERLLEELSDEDPETATIQFVFGSALADAGALTEADVALRRALELDPGAGVEVRRKLASVMIQMRRLPDAERLLEDLVAEDPTEQVSALWLAGVRRAMKVMHG